MYKIKSLGKLCHPLPHRVDGQNISEVYSVVSGKKTTLIEVVKDFRGFISVQRNAEDDPKECHNEPTDTELGILYLTRNNDCGIGLGCVVFDDKDDCFKNRFLIENLPTNDDSVEVVIVISPKMYFITMDGVPARACVFDS